MRKICIVSHGHLASGIKSAIGILTGKADSVEAIDAYVDDSDFTSRIEKFIDSVGPKDEAVIFTDIYGGSVFQKVILAQPERKGIFHVTGTNLAAVIQCLLSADPLTPKVIDELVTESARYLQRVPPVEPEHEKSVGEEGDFFS
jgi:PTS system mannose-specific IIA component